MYLTSLILENKTSMGVLILNFFYMFLYYLQQN
jgi:hypothetical protein